MSQQTAENTLQQILIAVFERQFKLNVNEYEWTTSWSAEVVNGQATISFITSRDGKNLVLTARLEIADTTKVNPFFITFNDDKQIEYTAQVLLNHTLFADLKSVIDTVLSEVVPVVDRKTIHREPDLTWEPKNYTKDRTQKIPTELPDIFDQPPSIELNSVTYINGVLTLDFSPFIMHPTNLEVRIRNFVGKGEEQTEDNKWLLVGRLKKYIGQSEDSISFAGLTLTNNHDLQIVSENLSIESRVYSLFIEV